MANPDERLVPLEPHDKPNGRLDFIMVLDLVNVYLNKGLSMLGAVCLFLMVIGVVANGIARAVYVPFDGATEVAGWLAALTIAFALGFTQIQEGYVEIDALVERFPLYLQRTVKSIMLFISMCFFAMVAWQLYLYAIQTMANGNLSETLKMSYYPLILVVAFGFVGLTLALLVDLLKELTGRAK